MIVRVVLEGAEPWGFRVVNDSRSHAPRVSKVSNEILIEECWQCCR